MLILRQCTMYNQTLSHHYLDQKDYMQKIEKMSIRQSDETEELKSLRNKIIVGVNLSQKEDYEIQFNDTKLFMNSSFGTDGKETNPTLAKVYYVGEAFDDIQSGDFILANHNTFK